MEKGDETRPSVDVDENGLLRGKSEEDETLSTEEHYGCGHYKRKSKFVVRKSLKICMYTHKILSGFSTNVKNDENLLTDSRDVFLFYYQCHHIACNVN